MSSVSIGSNPEGSLNARHLATQVGAMPSPLCVPATAVRTRLATRAILRPYLGTLTRILMVAVPLFATILSLHQLKGGWDDGAITAAYARTFAQTGRFALTPLSAEAEGFSSLTWLFLLAIPGYFGAHPETILIWMKVLSGISFLLSLVVFRRLARHLLLDAIHVDFGTILLCFVSAPMLETLNGMEMNFQMLLVLGVVAIATSSRMSRWRYAALWAFTGALVCTRFESPFLISIVVLALAWRKKSIWMHIAASALAFSAVAEIWRFSRFGVWMPNTIYAKLSLPYSPPHLLYPMLLVRSMALLEIFDVLGGLLVGVLGSAVIYMVAKRLQVQRWPILLKISGAAAFIVILCGLTLEVWPRFLEHALRPGAEIFILALGAVLMIGIGIACWKVANDTSFSTVIAALAGSGVVFTLVFGKNWGYAGRMVLPFLPFLVLACVWFLQTYIDREWWLRTALAGCLACQLITWIPVAVNAWSSGVHVSVGRVENIGVSVDAVRQLAQEPSVSVFLPDVGASALCCTRLEILDSALLTSSYLAHHGYAASHQFLSAQRPAVIETHGIWTHLTQVYRSHEIQNYNLVLVDRTRLLVRDDLYSRIYTRLNAENRVRYAAPSACLSGVSPSYPDEDIEFVVGKGGCLYVSQSDLAANGVQLSSAVKEY